MLGKEQKGSGQLNETGLGEYPQGPTCGAFVIGNTNRNGKKGICCMGIILPYNRVHKIQEEITQGI